MHMKLLLRPRIRIFGRTTRTGTMKTAPERHTTTAAIIHLFALAHAAVALASRALNYYDDVPLTILTVSMVAVIAIRHRLSLEVAAIVTLIASFVGFLAGVYGALALRILLRSNMLAPALTTFLLTELMGWSTYLIARRRDGDATEDIRWSPTATHIVVAGLLILSLRVGYMFVLRHLYPGQDAFYPELRRLFSNTQAMLLLLCCNLFGVHICVRLRRRGLPAWLQTVLLTVSLIGVSALTAAVICYVPGPRRVPVTGHGFLLQTIIVLLVCIALFALVSLGYYVLSSHRELKNERRQRHLAQYKYSQFKQQINPHFLFNSLNILDVLVQENQTERASAFIRKLAGLYRYMLRNEEEVLVTLREEMEFAYMYVDLIQERFSDGLTIRCDIPAELQSRCIVPGSVQQLLENATKHNIVGPDRPLHITIRAAGEWLAVENNLQPRLSRRSGSTHLGLKNISQQYLDIAGRDIRIEKTDDRFRVELPLLKSEKS